MGRYIKLASQLEAVNFSNVNAGDAVTAVNANFNNIFITESLNISGSITGSLFGTSSFATTASYALNAGGSSINTGSFATTGSNTFRGDQTITGSVLITGSFGVTGSIRSTVSVAAPTLMYTSIVSSNGGEIRLAQTQVRLNTNSNIAWAASTDSNATKDIGLRRNNTGSLEIYDGNTADGTLANRRDLLVRNITGSNVTISGSLTVITGSGIEFQVLSTGVKIGNLITDIHTVTGSLNISGSVFITSSLGVGVAPSATVGRIDASNDVVAFSTSDIRFKKNITPIPNALDKLNKIGGYTFDWNPDPELTKLHGFKGHDIGVIAQEIEKVLPELVTTRDNGYKAVKYEKLVALLIESNKELLKRIEVLESKINQ
jgi:hypothetical protein